MIAETLLVCWLVACAYVPFLLLMTREAPVEVRRITNALVRQKAKVTWLRETEAVNAIRRWDEWRKRCAVVERVPLEWSLDITVTAVVPAYTDEVTP